MGASVLVLVKRLALSLVTLFILSVIIFLGGQLLPGDAGRAIMGPFADARAVAALDHQLGVDRPLLVQYADWIGHFIIGDMGQSYTFRSPVGPFVASALGNSLKLASIAFMIVVPLSLLGGVYAALRAGRWSDRVITLVGLSASVIPEFVTGVVLILVFGVWLHWLPISASTPPGASVGDQFVHLLLPSIPLVLILFGYIARITRAGTIEVLQADYTRTAVLKGLTPATVLFRHVLRNALLPAIAVVGTQVGYLIGGLVVIEILFRYQGIGSLIYVAAKGKDFPMLESGILTVGVVYTVATLVADLLHSALNPRVRFGGAA